MEEMQKARVFRNGRSQAVRIPAKFRFTTDEVFVRQGSQAGELILSPTGQRTRGWDRLLQNIAADPLPDDFLQDREQGVEAEREAL